MKPLRSIRQIQLSGRYITHAHLILLFAIMAGGCKKEAGRYVDPEAYKDWSNYLGDKASTQYSSLDQINVDNAHTLEVAWTFSTGDTLEGVRTEIQCNPLIIDGVLYGTTPRMKVFALKADTGEMIWQFNPFEEDDSIVRWHNRGLNYWTDGADDRRLLFVAGPRLYAINADTGQPIPEFGAEIERGAPGSVDFTLGLDRDALEIFVSSTTPGVIYKDLLIQGSRVRNRAPGHIRAYNVRTGAIEWTFRTIPQPGEYGYETWPPDAWTRVGNANSWSGMSLDEERGIVYIPTGSPGYDFYGGDRVGDNLFGTSLIALDAATGERIWHFQFVRHDIWDRDLPAPPNLVTIERDGSMVDAVAQVTKHGYVFVFDRETGEPLFPMEEVNIPPSDVPGEVTSPTQPIPLKPEPFARQDFPEEDITDISEEAHQYILERYRQYRTEHRWDPPSVEGTVIFPGYDGGAEWGGSAFDPESGILYVNSNEMPRILHMVEVGVQDRPQVTQHGRRIYTSNCAACHGAHRGGDEHSDIPSLIDIGVRLNRQNIRTVIENGQGIMPPFRHLSSEETETLVTYLLDPEGEDAAEENGEIEIERMDHAYHNLYSHKGYTKFVDKEGYPAIKPPWGTLNAINLNTGEYVWKVRFGEHEELTKRGIPLTGTENYGGPVVTAGGVLFIGATQDERFRVYNKHTGEMLWETDLPFGGYATPAVYEVDGRQYVVIAAGGGKLGTPSGDKYVAFALPEK